MRVRPGRAAQSGQGVSAIAPLRRTRPPARPRWPPALPRSAAVLGARRVFSELGKVIGDLEPRRLVRDKAMQLRSDTGIVIERAERDAEFGCRRLVDDWRAAEAAE